MADHSQEHEAEQASRMGRAIVRGIVIGMPVCVVGLTVAVWLLTDLGWMDSFVTAILPGAGLGGFAGGFAGIASTAD